MMRKIIEIPTDTVVIIQMSKKANSMLVLLVGVVKVDRIETIKQMRLSSIKVPISYPLEQKESQDKDDTANVTKDADVHISSFKVIISNKLELSMMTLKFLKSYLLSR
jgi:hypothetical protein